MWLLYSNILNDLKRHDNGLFLYKEFVSGRVHIKIINESIFESVITALRENLVIIKEKDVEIMRYDFLYHRNNTDNIQSLGIDFLYNNSVELKYYTDIVELSAFIVIDGADFVKYLNEVK